MRTRDENDNEDENDFFFARGRLQTITSKYKNAAAEENIVHEPRGARSANQQTATMGRAHEAASAFFFGWTATNY